MEQIYNEMGVMGLDDKKIIELFNARSEQAITEVQGKYGGLCGKIAYNILNNYEDAEECVSTSYVKLWNAIPPKNPESLCGYLCRIVRNTALTAYQKIKQRGFEEQLVELSEVISDGYSVENSYDSSELGQHINDFLRGLNQKKRVVFVARYYYNMSISDISQSTSIGENTVKSILMRTRQELRTYLEERGISV